MIPRFKPGDTVVIQDVWKGHLWAAAPHVWVENEDAYVTYAPLGSVYTCATNKGLTEVAGMSRSQRVLEALASCVYTTITRRAELSTLHFFSPDSWARVNLGWTAEGVFNGWYVNFELPLTLLADGLQTKDLLLDICIAPDRTWRWKDADEFDTAIERGILPADLRTTLLHEADRVIASSQAETGPFARAWRDWTPDPDLKEPILPRKYRMGGSAWANPTSSADTSTLVPPWAW